MCVNCKHQLAALDLIPVVSWIWLKGRCRYCKKPISWQYPLVEVLFTVLLVALYILWPVALSGWQWLLFVLWIPMLVCGFALTIIDIKHQMLPSNLVYTLAAFAGAYTVVDALLQSDYGVVTSAIFGGFGLFTLFYAIYQLSGGKWIGGGDVRLVAVIGLLLGWQRGILAILLASYLATAVIIILVIAHKYHKKMHIAFGPFLLLATYLAFLYGDTLIDFYRKLTGL